MHANRFGQVHKGPSQSRRVERRNLALLVAAATLLGGAGAFALKEQCNHIDWDERHLQYWRYCYSDILPLYDRFHLGEDRWPYDLNPIELGGGPYGYTPVEYPVATVAFAYAVALITEGKVAYLEVTNALLVAGAGVVAWALWKSGVDWRRIAFWGVGPPLIIHGTTNWDLLAAACCMAGWWAWGRKRPMLAAALFGLGGAAKLYPAFFLPYLAWETLFSREPGGRRFRPDYKAMTDVIVGTLIGFVLPNFIVWRMTPQAWLDVWRFHSKRDPDFETAFEAIREGLQKVGWGWEKDELWRTLIGTGGLVVLCLCGLYLAWAVWKRDLQPLVAGAIAVILFLLLNRVYSPQYTLWVFPLLLALRAPWVSMSLFVAADLAVFLIRYPLMAQAPGEGDAYQVAHRIAVIARWIFLATCLWQIARMHGALGTPKPAEPAHTADQPVTPASGDPSR